MEQIMQASTPLACKNLGKTIKNCDLKKWNKEASEVCYPGLLEKFKQNPGLCAFLKTQGTKLSLNAAMMTYGVMEYPLPILSALTLIATNSREY